MKRFATVLVVLVPVALFVAGCGGGSGGTNPPKSFKPEEMKMPPDIAKKFQQPPAPGKAAK